MRIPLPLLIIWLEVNVTGKTILPEIYTVIFVTFGLMFCLMGKLTWLTLIYGTKRIGMGVDFM